MQERADIPNPFPRTERALRRFIATNLDLLEPGLRPYPDAATCQEFAFSCGHRNRAGIIDVLCTDRNGAIVIIEVKLLATASSIGQLLGYIGWATRSIGRDRGVRGMIVAVEVSSLLVLAMRMLRPMPFEIYKLSEERIVRVT